jgi:hypothetical protein
MNKMLKIADVEKYRIKEICENHDITSEILLKKMKSIRHHDEHVHRLHQACQEEFDNYSWML